MNVFAATAIWLTCCCALWMVHRLNCFLASKAVSRFGMGCYQAGYLEALVHVRTRGVEWADSVKPDEAQSN